MEKRLGSWDNRDDRNSSREVNKVFGVRGIILGRMGILKKKGTAPS
jgi:hypothetical protein